MTSKDRGNSGYTEVFAWGSDHAGQMGLAGKNYPIPRFCSFNVIIHTLSCGDEHSAFIASNGYIYTMGSNADGRLGISSRGVKYSSSPCLVEVLSRYKAVKVSCGWGHTAAVVETGELFTWGYGGDGQLGIGSVNNHHSPQLVQYLNATTGKNVSVFTSDVDSGARHTAAISDKGELYMFGSAEYGQLGTGRLDKEVYPCKIDLYNKTMAVSCGIKHTLILSEKGKVYACGNNASGELGTGNKRASFIFSKLTFPNEDHIKKISAGQHSAALSESGELYLWGTGSFGEFLQPQKTTGIKNPIVDVAIGGGFGCAIDIGGSLYTYGSNKFGELGQGDYDARLVPTLVTSLQGKRVTSVACGGNFAMALGITIVHKPDDSIRSRYGIEMSGKNSETGERESVSQRDVNVKRELEVRRDKSADNQRIDEYKKSGLIKTAFDDDLEALKAEIIKKEIQITNNRAERSYSPYNRSPRLGETGSSRTQSTHQKSPREFREFADKKPIDQNIINVSFEADRNFFRKEEATPPGEKRLIREDLTASKVRPDQNADIEAIRKKFEESRTETPGYHRRTATADLGGRTSPFLARDEPPKDIRDDESKEQYRLSRENRVLRDNLHELKKQLTATERIQLEEMKLRDQALERRYDKLEVEYADLEKRYRNLERELLSEKDSINIFKRTIDDERAQNERNLKVLQDNQTLISHLENENKRMIERQSKGGAEYLEAEKEKEYYKKRCDELQRKLERNSHEYNESLKYREEAIEKLQQEKGTIENAFEEISTALKKLSKETAIDRETIDKFEKEKQKDLKIIDGYKYELQAQREMIDKLQKGKEDIVGSYEEKVKKMTDENRRLEHDLIKKRMEVEELEKKVRHVEKLFDDKKIEIKELRSLQVTLEASIQSKNHEIRHLKSIIEEMNYRTGRNHFNELDASRISPGKSFNLLNETADLSRAEELITILKRDAANRQGTSFKSKGRGGYDHKSRDTIDLTGHDSMYQSRKGNVVDDDYRAYVSPFKARQKGSPMVRIGSQGASPEREDRLIEKAHEREKDLTPYSRRHSTPTLATEKSEVLERYEPHPKLKEVGRAADKLMEILTLDAKEKQIEEDRKRRIMEVIGEEESGMKSNTDLQYTAKFSKEPTITQSISVEKNDLKLLEGVEIPLGRDDEEEEDEDEAVDESRSYEAFLRKHQERVAERSKTPEKGSDQSNLKDLKHKLQDLQKNKIALEQRMQDFERRLQESKKKQ